MGGFGEGGEFGGGDEGNVAWLAGGAGGAADDDDFLVVDDVVKDAGEVGAEGGVGGVAGHGASLWIVYRIAVRVRGRGLVAEPEVDDGEGEEGGVETVEPAAVAGEHRA